MDKRKSTKDKQRSTKHTHKTLVDGDKSWTRKEPGSIYDKWNISVVICDTDIP